VVSIDIDRIFHGRAVSGAFLVGRERGEAKHPPCFGVDRHDRRECSAASRQPFLLLAERARHDVERGGGVGYFVVVDLGDRRCVGAGSESDGDRGSDRLRAGHGVSVISAGSSHGYVRPAHPASVGARFRGCERHSVGYTCTSVRGSAAHWSALLAQSAEHSHGKAGVVGSIPTEGSTNRSGQPVRGPGQAP
jgi:hypothetical protein